MIRPISKKLELSVNIDCDFVTFYDKKGKKYIEFKFNKILDAVFLQEIVKKGFLRKTYYKLQLDDVDYLFDEESYKRFMEDYSNVRHDYFVSLKKLKMKQKATNSVKDNNQKKIVKPKKGNIKTKDKAKRSRKDPSIDNSKGRIIKNSKNKTKDNILPQKNKTKISKEKLDFNKEKSKKEPVKTIKVNAPKIAEVKTMISKALNNTGLNNHEIKNKIVVTMTNHQELDLQIDLHSLTLEVTNNVLLNILNMTKLNINQLKLIHGHNRGTILKNYLMIDFSHHRIAKKEVDASNEGITIFKLKALDISKSNNKKVIIRNLDLNKRDVKVNETELRENIKDASDFMLTMIKEKIKSADIKSKQFNRIYESVLNKEECKYCRELFKYNFSLRFFLDSLREYYEYKDKQYMKISFKRKTYEDCHILLNQLVEKFDQSKLECIIKVDKNIGKRMLLNLDKSNENNYRISIQNVNEVMLIVDS